jgi:hypothetical protein
VWKEMEQPSVIPRRQGYQVEFIDVR